MSCCVVMLAQHLALNCDFAQQAREAAQHVFCAAQQAKKMLCMSFRRRREKNDAPFYVRRRRKTFLRRLNALSQVLLGHIFTVYIACFGLRRPSGRRRANTPAAGVAPNMPAARVVLRATDAGAPIYALSST